MAKTTSTRAIIEYLEAYEKLNGVGAVGSVDSVCGGNRTIEYIFYIQNKDGVETCVEIPAIEKNNIW